MLRSVLVAAFVLVALAGCAGEDEDGIGVLDVQVGSSIWGDGGQGEIRCPDARAAVAPGVACGFIDRHREAILFAPPARAACRGGPPTIRVAGRWRGRRVEREVSGCVPSMGAAGAQLLAGVILRADGFAHGKGYVRCESAALAAGSTADLAPCTQRVLWTLDPRRRLPRTVEGCVKGWNRHAHTHRRHARNLLARGLDRVRVSLGPPGSRTTGCVVRFAGASGSVAFRARWLGRELRWLAPRVPGPRAAFRANVRVNENADLWLPR